jgi:hypothetical protein
MNASAIALALLLSAQMTPKDLGRAVDRREARKEVRAGVLITDHDRDMNGCVHGGDRIRQIDKPMTNQTSVRIQWPHTIGGKPYDLLGKEDRELPLEAQNKYVVEHGWPEYPPRGPVITPRMLSQRQWWLMNAPTLNRYWRKPKYRPTGP